MYGKSVVEEFWEEIRKKLPPTMNKVVILSTPTGESDLFKIFDDRGARISRTTTTKDSKCP